MVAPRVVTPPRRHRRSDGPATAAREHRRFRDDERAKRNGHCTSVRHRIIETASGAHSVDPIPRCRNVSTKVARATSSCNANCVSSTFVFPRSLRGFRTVRQPNGRSACLAPTRPLRPPLQRHLPAAPRVR